MYEVEGGDLILVALAHCANAPIMIVNCNSREVPFYFVAEDTWGGKVSNKTPIVLVHDGSHYENIKPATKLDEDILRDVFQFWKCNDFKISRRDISNAKIEARKDRSNPTWADIAKRNIAAKDKESFVEKIVQEVREKDGNAGQLDTEVTEKQKMAAVKKPKVGKTKKMVKESSFESVLLPSSIRSSGLVS